MSSNGTSQIIELNGQNHFQVTRALGSWPSVTYKTSAHTPPYLNIEWSGAKLAEGYIFLTPSDITHQRPAAGYVLDMEGNLIYAIDDTSVLGCTAWAAGITDLRVQAFYGRPHLTYWNGCNERGAHPGYRWGSMYLVDEEYLTFGLNPDLGIKSLDQATLGDVDMHDHEVTERSTVVVTSYNNTLLGSNYIADGLVFELDVETGNVLFEWHALDHLPTSATHYCPSGDLPWDWMHLNSAQKVGDNYLISARNHFSVYLVSGADGSIIWNLNGEGNGTWSDVPAPFRWQHHARASNVTTDGMTVSLFNNNNSPNTQLLEMRQSEALAYWVPTDTTEPLKLVRQLRTESEPIYSIAQGSYQLDIGGGHGFVGYGQVPRIREYGADGDLLWQAKFGYENATMSYRAFKHMWHGTPRKWDPIVVFEPHEHQSRAYVSWNGATDISHWIVDACTKDNDCSLLGMVAKIGFETFFNLPSDVRCIRIGAVRREEIIRYSNIVCLWEPDQSSVDLVSLDGEQHPPLSGIDASIDNIEWYNWVLTITGMMFLATGIFIVWRDYKRRKDSL
jgi:hypothetical protein